MAKHDPHFETEFVQRHVDMAVSYVSSFYRGMLNAMAPNHGFDSPLESAFYVWWIANAWLSSDDQLGIQPQAEVVIGGETFRLDFALLPVGPIDPSNPYPIKVAIELDGHDFHERTKEQVDRRNYRDRRLLEAGWDVLHFSGSEFNRDPIGCVRSAAAAGQRALWRRY